MIFFLLFSELLGLMLGAVIHLFIIIIAESARKQMYDIVQWEVVVAV